MSKSKLPWDFFGDSSVSHLTTVTLSWVSKKWCVFPYWRPRSDLWNVDLLKGSILVAQSLTFHWEQKHLDVTDQDLNLWSVRLDSKFSVRVGYTSYALSACKWIHVEEAYEFKHIQISSCACLFLQMRWTAAREKILGNSFFSWWGLNINVLPFKLPLGDSVSFVRCSQLVASALIKFMWHLAQAVTVLLTASLKVGCHVLWQSMLNSAFLQKNLLLPLCDLS